MAHFAKLGVNGKVIAVHGLDNDQMLNADGVEDETVGQQRLQEIHGWPAQMWIQTSYNTRGNKYYNEDGTEGDQSKKLRGNYAGIGWTWDEDNQIFWAPQEFASWTKNTSTAMWEAPIAYPSVTTYTSGSDTLDYAISWNESLYQGDNTKGWKAQKTDNSWHTWNAGTSAWDAD